MPVPIEEPHRVLLLEDNRDDEGLALRALRSCGLPLCVTVARDGAQALRALGLDGEPSGGQAPDLVISDLKMPKLGGDEVLCRVRSCERLRDLPFVVFSSSDETSDVRRCMGLGATAYYSKPVGYDDYMECVAGVARRWLKGDTIEPPCVVSRGTLR